MSERQGISREEFEALVRRRAYTRWREREFMRRDRNWRLALGELEWNDVPSNDLRYPVVKAKAERIRERLKDADSREDWFEAKC